MSFNLPQHTTPKKASFKRDRCEDDISPLKLAFGTKIKSNYKEQNGTTYERTGTILSSGTPSKYNKKGDLICAWEEGGGLGQVGASVRLYQNEDDLLKIHDHRENDMEEMAMALLNELIATKNTRGHMLQVVADTTGVHITNKNPQRKLTRNVIKASRVGKPKTETAKATQRNQKTSLHNTVLRQTTRLSTLVYELVLDRAMKNGTLVELKVGKGKQTRYVEAFANGWIGAGDAMTDANETIILTPRGKIVKSETTPLNQSMRCFTDAKNKTTQYLVSPSNMSTIVRGRGDILKTKQRSGRKKIEEGRGATRQNLIENQTIGSQVSLADLKQRRDRGELNASFMPPMGVSAEDLVAGDPARLLREIKHIHGAVTKQLTKQIQRVYNIRSKFLARDLKLEKKNFAAHMESYYNTVLDGSSTGTHVATDTEPDEVAAKSFTDQHKKTMAQIKKKFPLMATIMEVLGQTGNERQNKGRTVEKKEERSLWYMQGMIHSGNQDLLKGWALTTGLALLDEGCTLATLGKLCHGLGASASESVTTEKLEANISSTIQALLEGFIIHDNVDKYIRVRNTSTKDGNVSTLVHYTVYASWTPEFNYDEYSSVPQQMNLTGFREYYEGDPFNPNNCFGFSIYICTKKSQQE